MRGILLKLFGSKNVGILPIIYCLWAALSIGLSIAVAGLTNENITRILVIVFLLLQIMLKPGLVKLFPWVAPKIRFILFGTLLAIIVEGFHMISRPVFLSLTIDKTTSFIHGLWNFAVDLIFTVPAYLIIFSVIWYFIKHFNFTFWQYVFVMGLAQALGDGGIFFFISAPLMLIFLPYPMTNYHAINVIPYLSVIDELPNSRKTSRWVYLAIPSVIGTYLVCGGIIKVTGKYFGFE